VDGGSTVEGGVTELAEGKVERGGTTELTERAETESVTEVRREGREEGNCHRDATTLARCHGRGNLRWWRERRGVAPGAEDAQGRRRREKEREGRQPRREQEDHRDPVSATRYRIVLDSKRWRGEEDRNEWRCPLKTLVRTGLSQARLPVGQSGASTHTYSSHQSLVWPRSRDLSLQQLESLHP